MTFFYLATPYSKYPAGLDAAFQEACRNAGLLIAAKIPVFCPIAHTHPIAMACEIDALDHSIWLPADQPMMDAACGIIVVMMDGWFESRGIEHELEAFTKAGKPIVYMEPGEVPDKLIGWLP